MDYKKAILDWLLTKHQSGRSGFEEGEQTSLFRSVSKDNSLMWKRYSVGSDPKESIAIEDAVIELEKGGFVEVKRDMFDETIEKIRLNPEKINEAYEITGHERKRDIRHKELSFIHKKLSEYSSDSIANRYLIFLQERIKDCKPHKEWFDDLDDLSFQLACVNAIENQGSKEEILLRNLSSRKFGDSKIMEKNGSKLLKIFNKFDWDYENFGELCGSYNILKEPSTASLKNGVLLKVGEQEIDLDKLGTFLSLSRSAIEGMKVVKIRRKKIITIENLTTFYSFDDPEAVVVYLGGYQNTAKTTLIKKLAEAAPADTEYFHFGDIDCGGFNILINLRDRTGIPFKPYKMGIDELREYDFECRLLSENDIKRLKSLKARCGDEFGDVIDYMIRYHVKLEQEAIVLKKD